MHKFIQLKKNGLKHHFSILFQEAAVPLNSQPLFQVVQYGKWGRHTMGAAAGGTKHPSRPASCQGLLEEGTQPRHLPLTCSSGDFLLTPTTLITLSLLDSQRKNMSWDGLLPRIVSFDGHHQGRKSKRKTSHQFIAIKSDVWIQNLNWSTYFCVPVQAICALSQRITLRSEHLQRGWKGRNGKGEQRRSWLPTARWIAIC